MAYTYVTSRKLLTLVFFCLIVSGCSSTRLAYSNLNWLAVWTVTEYVPLTGDQKSDLKRAVGDHLQWHCESQLPDYVVWLDAVADTIRTRDFDRERISGYYADLFVFIDRIGSEIIPTASRTLASLDDAQIEALFENLEARNRELREKHLDPSLEEQVARRAERLEERLESWFGGISAEQRQLIAGWAALRDDQNATWLAGREQWQAGLAEALEGRQNEDFERQVTELLNNPDRFKSAAATASMDAGRAQAIDLTQRLLAVSSEQQLTHLLAELDRFRGDLDTLTCAPE